MRLEISVVAWIVAASVGAAEPPIQLPELRTLAGDDATAAVRQDVERLEQLVRSGRRDLASRMDARAWRCFWALTFDGLLEIASRKGVPGFVGARHPIHLAALNRASDHLEKVLDDNDCDDPNETYAEASFWAISAAVSKGASNDNRRVVAEALRNFAATARGIPIPANEAESRVLLVGLGQSALVGAVASAFAAALEAGAVFWLPVAAGVAP